LNLPLKYASHVPKYGKYGASQFKIQTIGAEALLYQIELIR